MKRLGVLAAGCGALAITAALGIPAAGAQSVSFITTIVYASHDTPDGTQGRLACDAVQSTTNCHIYVTNVDGSGRALTSENANDIDPVFSPDGTRIAFARSVGGPQGQYDIYAMNSDGSNLAQLTSEPKDDRYPAWSPDGSKIAFRGYPAVGGGAIFTMNPDGSAAGAIKNTGGGDQPTWSPDSTRVAYSGTYPNGTDPVTGAPIIADDIFVQQVNATNATFPVNVTNDAAMSDRYPSWQPTAGSSQILYRRVQANGRELWRVDAGTGATVNLTVDATQSKGRAASWSPDGTSAAFVSYVDGEGDLEIWTGVVDLASSKIVGARQITNNAYTDDEPKIASVPAPVSAVPSGTPPATTGGGGSTGGNTTGTGAAGVVGVVSNGGTTITVGGGPLPGGKTSLSLALTVPKQTLARKKALLAYARCNARCSVNVTGLTKLKVGDTTKTLRLFRVKKTIKAKARTRVSLRLPTKTLLSVRSALRRHKQVKFTISATARTTAGEFTPAAIRTLTLHH
jgi:Tol biopolymer transport system component